MRSIYLDSVLHIWNSTGSAEKKRVRKQFLKQHDGHFNVEQFLTYLEQRYVSRFSSYVLPSLPERKALPYQL